MLSLLLAGPWSPNVRCCSARSLLDLRIYIGSIYASLSQGRLRPVTGTTGSHRRRAEMVQPPLPSDAHRAT